MSSSSPPPIRLQVLGPVRVGPATGNQGEALLTQPRRLAVLVYLALARPRGLHSRDTLIALLWPEADQVRGRHALRNALHAIRQALGENLVVTEGDNNVGINPALLDCDALALETDLGAGRTEEALARYQGELLQGFHVVGSVEFEDWLERERARLLGQVSASAWSQADLYGQQGDVSAAVAAAWRAYRLTPGDETSLRRLLHCLQRSGDRAGGLKAYEEFAARLEAEYDTTPSVETQALVASFRAANAVPPSPPVTSPQPITAGGEMTHGSSQPSPHRRSRLAALIALPLAAVALGLALKAGQRGPTTTLQDATTAADHRAILAFAHNIPALYKADTSAFQRYLRLENMVDRMDASGARDSFQAFVESNPLYAPAWGGYAMAWSMSGFEDIPPRFALPRSVAAAERALALDSNIAQAHYVLIANEMFGNWDLEEAKERLDIAFARWPDDPELWNLLATWHRWRGELAEAVDLKRRALRLDPLSPRYANQVAWNLYLSHRCEESAEVNRLLAEEYREAASAHLALSRALNCLGKESEAVAALRTSLYEQGDSANARLFDPPLTPERIRAARSQLYHSRLNVFRGRRAQGYMPPVGIVMQYAELKNKDSTLLWLDSMFVERDQSLHIVPFDPLYDFLRGDSRFQAFLSRLPWHPRLQQIDSLPPPSDRP